jgi:hypothetical protein
MYSEENETQVGHGGDNPCHGSMNMKEWSMRRSMDVAMLEFITGEERIKC